MSEPNNQSQSEQPAEVSQAPEVSAEQTPPDAATQVETASMEDLSQALFGVNDTPEEPSRTPEEAAPAAVTEEAPPEEPGSEEQPPAESESPAPSEATAETLAPSRVSVRGLPAEQRKEAAQAAELVRTGKATDLLDALAQIRGVTPPSAAAPADQPSAPEATPSTPETTPNPEISTLEARRTELRQQREDAAADFDQAKVNQLTNEIEDLGIQIAEARAEERISKRQQEATAAAYEQQVDAAFDAMEAKYPEALNAQSKFHQLLQDKIVAAEARQDPALRDPNYVLKFAEEVHGILNPGPKAPPPPKPQAPQKPVGTSVAPAHTAVQRYTDGQKVHAIQSASFEDLEAALFGG